MRDGIICVDKPQDFTSFDVVAKCRGILSCRKLGHGGTLDPMATGVLPLFVGRATKAMDIMPVQDKRYTASFRLGVRTDTQDSSGTILAESDLPVDRSQLEAALQSQRGEIQQLPPMYSAVQLDGRRLYDLARQGLEVERPARTVTVHSLVLLDYDRATRSGTLDIRCSKGTYIRTIIEDVGLLLGCGGTMTALRRTETLGYDLARCYTLAQLQALREQGRLEEIVLPIETAFSACPAIYLTEKQVILYQNGVRLDTDRMTLPPEALLPGVRCAVWREDTFVGTAFVDSENKELLPDKLFRLREPPGSC